MKYEIMGDFNYDLFKSDPSTRGYAYESITEDELRAIHAEELQDDAEAENWMTQDLEGEGMHIFADPDFGKWLEDCINRKRIRIVE